MNKTELAQSLWTRVKNPDADLAQLLEEYRAAISEFTTDPAYYGALRRLREELPDLDRLAGRKHDAVLRGRLLDAIGALKNQVQEIKAQSPLPEQPADTPDSEKRVRNMPNLGMD